MADELSYEEKDVYTPEEKVRMFSRENDKRGGLFSPPKNAGYNLEIPKEPPADKNARQVVAETTRSTFGEIPASLYEKIDPDKEIEKIKARYTEARIKAEELHKKELELAGKKLEAGKPQPATLNKIPDWINILMLSLDAYTGKPRWLHHLTFERPLMEKLNKEKHQVALSSWQRQHPDPDLEMDIAKMRSEEAKAGDLERIDRDEMNELAQPELIRKQIMEQTTQEIRWLEAKARDLEDIHQTKNEELRKAGKPITVLHSPEAESYKAQARAKTNAMLGLTLHPDKQLQLFIDTLSPEQLKKATTEARARNWSQQQFMESLRLKMEAMSQKIR